MPRLVGPVGGARKLVVSLSLFFSVVKYSIVYSTVFYNILLLPPQKLPTRKWCRVRAWNNFHVCDFARERVVVLQYAGPTVEPLWHSYKIGGCGGGRRIFQNGRHGHGYLNEQEPMDHKLEVFNFSFFFQQCILIFSTLKFALI